MDLIPWICHTNSVHPQQMEVHTDEQYTAVELILIVSAVVFMVVIIILIHVTHHVPLVEAVEVVGVEKDKQHILPNWYST